MKKNEIILLIYLLIINVDAYSQIDSINNKSKERISFGGVPILSYDADIGFKYGAVVNYYKYNDTSKNQLNYSENLFLRIFNSSKNSLQIRSVYETDNLFKNAKVFLEASYINDKFYDFFGYNGTQTIVNPAFIDKNSIDFINRKYYSFNRKFTRFRFDYQHNIRSENLHLLTGFTFNKLNIQYDDSISSLYTNFINNQSISENEKNGGYANYFTVGIVYDKRNNQCYCSDGKWFESFLVLSPKLISSSGFSKLIVTYKSYKTVLHGKFVLMTRTSLQAKLSGQIPSFFQTNYFDTKLNHDGLGGFYNVRGFRRNRIATSGFLLSNIEFRKQILKKVYFKTDVDVDISIFTDNALIIQPYIYPEKSISNYNIKNYDKFYSSAGLGLYIVLNKNNVISVNYGLPLNHNEFKKGALYIGSSFLF